MNDVRSGYLDSNDVNTNQDAQIQGAELARGSLTAIREHVDVLDVQLVRLLAIRLALVVSAARCKTNIDSIGSPDRVDGVLEQVRLRAEQFNADPDVIAAIYHVIIEQGIDLERSAYKENQQICQSDSWSTLLEDPVAGVEAGHLMKVMATMRAMRRLDDRPVETYLIDKLLEAASWAPAGANQQHYRFVVVTDRPQLARLAPHWRNAMEFYLGTLCPVVSPEEQEQFERVRAAMIYQCTNFVNIPALIIVCNMRLSFYKRVIHHPVRSWHQISLLSAADRVKVLANLRPWASRASAASVYPAVQNLLLAARAYGLGATLTTWHSAFEQEFKSILGIPKGVSISAIIPIGYPLGRFGVVSRGPLEKLIDRDYWRKRKVDDA